MSVAAAPDTRAPARRHPVRLLALALVVATASLAIPGAATAAVPQGWLGTVIDGPLGAPAAFERESPRMSRSGVETVRFAIHWRQAQPWRTWAEVPELARSRMTDMDGVPTNLNGIDPLVAVAARRGMTVRVNVLDAPGWAAATGGDVQEPRDPADYARFVAGLVRRYGTQGTFWREHPDLPARPIRDWGVWNEPNICCFWRQPFAESYVRLLRASAAAIRGADPKARVVLGALVNESWTALEQIYAEGGKGLFDVLDLHPYTAKPENVLRIIRRNRAVMRRHGEQRPIVISELSWPTGAAAIGTKFGFETTPKGAARRLRKALRLLGAKRRAYRIEAVHYYTWASTDRGDFPWNYAGLFRITSGARLEPKPAYTVFRREARRLEACPRARVAGRCRR